MEQNTHTIHHTKELNKEWLITLLFSIFLGVFGVHRFYNGKIGTGILMLITFGGFGIWKIIDIILIALEKFTDEKGKIITMYK